MSEDFTLFNRFAKKIKSLPDHTPLKKEDILIPKFQLYKEEQLNIYYAPFDYVNVNAKIALIGITPGWTQMEISYRSAKQSLRYGLSPIEICCLVKQQASFAGTMRRNLTSMLDELTIPKYLGIKSSASLFNDCQSMLHTTSVLRYPVFIDGVNYTGHKPILLETEIFRHFVIRTLAKELNKVRSAIIVPLGKSVSEAIRFLINRGEIDIDRCCIGFPHPSGANAHRKRQFEENRLEMKWKLKKWFTRADY